MAYDMSLAHLSSQNMLTAGRTTRRLVNVIVWLLGSYAHMISAETDMLMVTMDTEIGINLPSYKQAREQVSSSK